jgi:hypothetical protein
MTNKDTERCSINATTSFNEFDKFDRFDEFAMIAQSVETSLWGRGCEKRDLKRWEWILDLDSDSGGENDAVLLEF